MSAEVHLATTAISSHFGFSPLKPNAIPNSGDVIPMAHDVFITYSSKDRNAADAICRTLEENRIRCWYAPRNIRSGTSWAASIIDGLDNSRVMILVWSANSNSSPHVTREVHHAFNKGITVIPFRIEDVEPTQELEYYLESVQWFDALIPPLEGNLHRLVEHIQTILPADQPSSEPDAEKLRAEAEEALARERAAKEARILAEEEELASQKRAAEEERLRLEEERSIAEVERRRLETEARQWAEAEAARKQAEEQQAAEAQRKQSKEKEAERARLAEVAAATREKPRLKPTETTTGLDDNQAAIPVRTPEIPKSLALPQSQPATSGRALPSSSVFDPYPSTSSGNFPVWRVVIPGVVVVIVASVVLYAVLHQPKDVASTGSLHLETPTPATTNTNVGSEKRVPKAWELKQTLSGHKSTVESVTFSPDGKTIVSASADETVKLWNAETGELIRTLLGHRSYVYSVAVSPDGKTIASAGFDDKTIKLWDMQTGVLNQTLKGHEGPVVSVAFAPDGSMLASGSWDTPPSQGGTWQTTVIIWDAATGKLKQRLIGHSNEVNTVAFSPDSKILASGGQDKKIMLWDLQTWHLKLTLPTSSIVSSLAFSADGKSLASGGDIRQMLSVWNVQTGQMIWNLKGHSKGGISVAFSPDGKTLMSGSYDTSVRFWNMQTGEQNQTIRESDVVGALAFSPDGKTIALAVGKNIRVWSEQK